MAILLVAAGARLPFKIEVVYQDAPIWVEQLWLPGVAAQNYLPCALGVPLEGKSSSVVPVGSATKDDASRASTTVSMSPL